MTEQYGKDWKHATIHLLPETMEMHSDGDHEVRLLINNKIKALEQKLADMDEALLSKDVYSLQLEQRLAEAEKGFDEWFETVKNRNLPRHDTEDLRIAWGFGVIHASMNLEKKLKVATDALEFYSNGCECCPTDTRASQTLAAISGVGDGK